jgi:putative ABC transport system substrate-binding protein
VNRRELVALGAAMLAGPLASFAQTRAPYKLGILALEPPMRGPSGGTLPHLRASLRRLGYEEGKNLLIEERWASGDLKRLDEQARDLVRLKPDVLVPVTNYEIAAFKRIAHAIPTVMYFGAMPVELGFIQSYARPGGNITGTAYHSTETAGKIVDLLREAVPQVRRTALLWNPEFPAMRLYGREVDRVAAAIGMTIEYFDATTPHAMAGAIQRIAASRAQALFVAYDSIIGCSLDEISAFAIQRRLVSFGSSPLFALQGGCLAYGPDLAEVSERTASHIDRILRGARAGELPVEHPRKMQLVVNLRTARAIDYRPPQTMLSRADLVIE